MTSDQILDAMRSGEWLRQDEIRTRLVNARVDPDGLGFLLLVLRRLGAVEVRLRPDRFLDYRIVPSVTEERRDGGEGA